MKKEALFKEIEIENEISDELNKLSQGALNRYSEMTEFQRGFLCGLIRDYKPKKVLEIGIAAGGTTSVILKTLEKYNIDAEMYSVDISEKWYRDNKRESGFLKEELIKKDKIKHKFILGKPISYVIDQIGSDVDFLIIDTTHVVPGELLDFLICYPYLKEEAIVVLHDVIENLITGNPNEIATKILFDSIDADKFYCIGEDEYKDGFSNIAAFKVNKSTKKSIRNIFSALTLSWMYLMSEEDKNSYLECIRRNYSSNYYEWITQIFELQEFAVAKNKIRENYGRHIEILDFNLQKGNIYIYGAGYWADLYTKYLIHKNIEILGYIISDDHNKNESKLVQKYNLPIFYLSELQNKKDTANILLAIDVNVQRQCVLNLRMKGFANII